MRSTSPSAAARPAKRMTLVSLVAYIMPAETPAAKAHQAERVRAYLHPARDERGQKKDEQGLLDVEPAVVGHGRRDGGQGGRREPRFPGQSPGEEEEEQEEPRTEQRRHEPEGRFAEAGQGALARYPGHGQGQVIEARPVVVVRVEPVFAPLEEVSELDRLVGLVVVHGPDVQADDTEEKGAEDGAEKEPPEGLIRHLAGRP